MAPKGLATRPTTDRVREAWFSMLGPVSGRVVDLYAGTGALGFEALSRGAEQVLFVESARAAQRAIAHNAEQLGVTERVTLLSSTVEATTKTLQGQGPFDLVLTDPPWTQLSSATLALGRILNRELLAPDGCIVLGHPRGRPITLHAKAGLSEWKSRAWGDSAATFWCRTEDLSELP